MMPGQHRLGLLGRAKTVRPGEAVALAGLEPVFELLESAKGAGVQPSATGAYDL